MISKAVIRISATGKGSHGYSSIQKKLIAPVLGFNKRSLSIILFVTVVYNASAYAQGSGDMLSINSLIGRDIPLRQNYASIRIVADFLIHVLSTCLAGIFTN